MKLRSYLSIVSAGALLVSACSSPPPAAPTAAPAAKPTTAPAAAATAAPAAKPTAAAAAPTTAPAAAATTAPAAKPTTAAAAAPTTAAATSQYSQNLVRDAAITVDTTKYKKDGPYTIAALTQGPGNGWGLTYDVSIRAAADGNPNVKKLIFTPNDGDANKEISAMEDAISQKPDAIVLDPLGSAALVAPTTRAMAAGIPVILCANGIESDNFVTRVDIDLYQAGYQAADGLAKSLGGKGNVVLFSGIAGVDAAETWKKAAEDAIKLNPNMKIVASEYAQWSVATSKEKMAAIMAANPQIDGVWAGGGEMALGAALAFQDAGKPQPKYGFANVLNGFLRLAKENNLVFTGVPDPPSMSKLCLDTAIEVLQGKPLKKFINVAEVLPGSAAYDQTQIDKYYVPDLNDDFVPPATVPIKAYVDGGFARK
jgi:ABC-type sugar transport system substrate-binding protein